MRENKLQRQSSSYTLATGTVSISMTSEAAGTVHKSNDGSMTQDELVENIIEDKEEVELTEAKNED